MPHSLIAKLGQFACLSIEERDALRQITVSRRWTRVRENIVSDGEAPGPVRLILEGWACRYKQLADGRRQIVAVLLPGDVCDPQVGVLHARDHAIRAITPVTLAEIAHDRLADLATRHPRLSAALAWETQVAAAIQREWTVNLGQRDAVERLAHLFCELHARLNSIGLALGGVFEMPLRQVDLADAMGLTSVHVNRSLQEMRAHGWIVLAGRRLTIVDGDALQRVSLFDPSYLHADPVRPDCHVGDR